MSVGWAVCSHNFRSYRSVIKKSASGNSSNSRTWWKPAGWPRSSSPQDISRSTGTWTRAVAKHCAMATSSPSFPNPSKVRTPPRTQIPIPQLMLALMWWPARSSPPPAGRRSPNPAWQRPRMMDWMMTSASISMKRLPMMTLTLRSGGTSNASNAGCAWDADLVGLGND